MATLLLIGIGSGDPEHLTVQAISALNRVDVFFAFDKGAAAAELLELRREICRRYATTRPYRFVEVDDADRDRGSDSYRTAVDDWHDDRAARYETAMLAELGEDETGAVLVWGDPAFYDSTIRIVERVQQRGRLDLTVTVIPGISSIQVLAAAHATVLNGIGEPITITTGRRLAESVDAGADNIVVMLDGSLACRQFAHLDLTIHWGAYLGSADQILIAGRLAEVIDRIATTRAALKASKGWIMDTYLLRRSTAAG